MSSDSATTGPSAFETRALGAIGAEVRGLDLRRTISDEVFAVLRELVMREGLVLFRDQALPSAEQIGLGQRFGPLEQLDVRAEQEEPTLVVIGNLDSEGEVIRADARHMKLISINEGWHTDSSFREIPASFSVFSCVVGPEVGGDTFYANLRRGWVDLPEDLKARLYGLRGVHDYGAAYRARGNDEGGMIGYDLPAIVHPLVRRHPETGTTGLYVSEHISHIEGMDPAESRRLLDELLNHTTAENRVYRHHWSVGDVMIWDNRSMLHRAQGFDQRHPRVMHHVRVGGFERPIAAT